MSENGDPDRLGEAGMPDRANRCGGQKRKVGWEKY